MASSISRAVTIGDLRALARKRTPEFVFVPAETGGDDGGGPLRNVEGFRKYLLSPHALVDCSTVNQATTIFDRSYACPFGISAIGFVGILRRHAEQMLAEAAVEANVPIMLSGSSCASIEEIARIAPGKVWQQLYAARDPKITDDIVRRGRDAGVDVLVFTVDAPAPMYNHWLVRKGLKLPAQVPLRIWPYMMWQTLTHLRWSLEHGLRGGFPRAESWAPYAPPGASNNEIAKISWQQTPAFFTWAEVERLRKIWPGKFVLKGLVRPDDAARARDLGVDGVIASNHGGNKLDSMAPAIDVLPPIADEVGSDISVLFDGGIRRGSDVMIAMAMGAAFCMLGRATLYGVLAGGTEGALRAIEIMRAEIERDLKMIGCPDVAQLSPDFLHDPATVTARKPAAQKGTA